MAALLIHTIYTYIPYTDTYCIIIHSVHSYSKNTHSIFTHSVYHIYTYTSYTRLTVKIVTREVSQAVAELNPEHPAGLHLVEVTRFH